MSRPCPRCRGSGEDPTPFTDDEGMVWNWCAKRNGAGTVEVCPGCAREVPGGSMCARHPGCNDCTDACAGVCNP